MKLSIDSDAATALLDDGGTSRELPLYSPETFRLLSQIWLKVGWSLKYSYTFTWLGRPIIQLPEDLIRVQEVIYRIRPQVVIETGIAHGGSLIYYASLLKLMGGGRVIGIDVEIRPRNREAIERHGLSPNITLIDGSSTSAAVVERVRELTGSQQPVMVILDSNHSSGHVAAELEQYGPMVSEDSYIVATDGIMKDLVGVPGAGCHWHQDNPWTAVHEFVARHPEFVTEQPPWLFSESSLSENITYWPGAYLRRTKTGTRR
jgi:cephalosporin hydroxylase